MSLSKYEATQMVVAILRDPDTSGIELLDQEDTLDVLAVMAGQLRSDLQMMAAAKGVPFETLLAVMEQIGFASEAGNN